MEPERESVLKHNAKRTVWLEVGRQNGQPVERLVKRFHSPEVPDRLRDRFRAAREFRVLGRLRELGLPVPAPLEVRRRSGRWELVTEYVPDARRISELAEDPAGFGVRPERAVRELARLFGALYRRGLDHRDLHPGNILLDASGDPWLVDLAGARVRSRISPRCIVRDLVKFDAALRERVSLRLRGRFLVSFLEELPRRMRDRLPKTRDLLRRIEDEARELRRRDEERRTRRWLRESGDATQVQGERFAGTLRRGVGADVAAATAAWIPAARQQGLPAALDFDLPFPGQEALRLVGIADRSVDALTHAWTGAARLVGHGIGCARPACFGHAPRRFAAFELPSDARPLPAFAATGARRRRLARALGRLFGTLHDAGLDAPDLSAEEVWVDERMDARLSVGVEIEDLGPEERPAALARLHRVLGGATPLERAAFVAAWLGEQQHSLAERRALRAALTGG